MSACRELLAAARKTRPQMEVQDAVKLLYQRFFGPGHLITDPAAAGDYLAREFSMCEGDHLPTHEPLGNGLCRVNLAPYRALGGRAETLLRLLLRCAQQIRGDREGFLESLSELPSAGFDGGEAEAFLNSYRAAGCPAVHHSERYRVAYHPACRICLEQDARFLPLLAHLDATLPRYTAEHPLLLAIDGPAAGGKTTLAALLRDVYGCTVLHMDDFFLPSERKTPERLAQSGGNVDWERFSREILEPLTAGEEALLRPYDCRTGALGRPEPVERTPLMVTEGAYSLHPALHDAYPCKVFLSLSPQEQEARILRRNGPVMAKRFREEWIPLENAYFSACAVPSLCDFLF